VSRFLSGLTPLNHWHQRWHAHLAFEPRDLWVGVYWTRVPRGSYYRAHTKVYVCLLPTLPVEITVWAKAARHRGGP
jgi:hypothetical protein